MKQQELRIGNYVIGDGKVLKATISTLMTPDLYEPIPLTEQWLIDFGFILDREWEEISNPDVEDEKDIKFHNVKKYELKGWLNRCLYFILQQGFISCYVTPRHLTKIEFVHELQNLYFAITGQELTIKEKAKNP